MEAVRRALRSRPRPRGLTPAVPGRAAVLHRIAIGCAALCVFVCSTQLAADAVVSLADAGSSPDVAVSVADRGTGAEESFPESRALPIVGADLSFLPRLLALGADYRVEGESQDPLRIFAERGTRIVRLRIWHSPDEPWHGLDSTLAFARTVTDAGFDLMLDLHYSDTWADPGHQTKPSAWSGLDFATLVDSVRAYTTSVVRAFREAGATPRFVQIGNEIGAGLLWDEGRVGWPGSEYDTPKQWAQLIELLSAAAAGVRAGEGDAGGSSTDPANTNTNTNTNTNANTNTNTNTHTHTHTNTAHAGAGIAAANSAADNAPPIQIVVHAAEGGDADRCQWYFDPLVAADLDFDVIGLSYYPWWHGSLLELQDNLHRLASRYDRPIQIVETGYPWTLEGVDDTGNFVDSADQLHPGYGATPEGQLAFLRDLRATLRTVPGGLGTALLYWEPTFVSLPGVPDNPYENLTIFDFRGRALPSLGFAELPARSRHTSVQVLGDFNDWDITAPGMTEVEPLVWEDTLQVEAGCHLLKFVTDQSWDTPYDFGGCGDEDPDCGVPLEGTLCLAAHPGTALGRVSFPETGRYRFRFDERDWSYAIELLKAR